jgi:Tfp pilus assembly protein PilN
MLSKAEQTAELMEKVPRSYILATVTNALPDRVSLNKLAMDTTMIVTRGARKSGNSQVTVQLKITGYAPTDVQVARFIANLARNPLMEAVELVYTEEQEFEEDVVREFEVTVDLKRGADAVDAIAAGTAARGEAVAGGEPPRGERGAVQ